MRNRSREEHQRFRGRSPDREPRSRDQKQFRDREREPINKPDWRREERRGPFAGNKVVEKDRVPSETALKINRKEVCPFLVRVFYSINKENVFESNGSVPENEISLHLWMDCSLKQIGDLLRAYVPAIRTKQRFQFWRVFSEQGKSALCKQEMGTIMMHRRADRAEDRFLSSCKFRVGDFIDVSIYYK